jgi:LmbE family N-acetylglucosaminyl deacetylase
VDLPSGPGAVLSPHPDDAVLSAWSALRAPGDVVVVTVFAGVPPSGVVGRFDPVFGVDDSSALLRERLEEDTAALDVAQRPSVRLDLLDEQYRDVALDVGAVERALGAVIGDVEWLLLPAGIGAHPDHVVTRDAGHTVARERSLDVFLYAEFPYAVRWGWPSWVTGVAARPHLVPDALWPDDLRGFRVPYDDLVPDVVTLPDDELALKTRAIACYRTQYWALNAGPLDRLREPEIMRHELRWRVPPPN